MSDQSHPVTLGDLRVAFEDGWQLNSISHRPATVADLVSALRAEGVLVVARWLAEYDGFAVVNNSTRDLRLGLAHSIFDALAEAQPFPPAGGVS